MEDSNQPEENSEKSIVINFEEDSVSSPENPEEIEVQNSTKIFDLSFDSKNEVDSDLIEAKKSKSVDVKRMSRLHSGTISETEILEDFHERPKTHKCITCNFAFDKSGELKRHIAAVHEGKKPYQCRICNECFFINSERKKHIEAVHDGNNIFKCSICKESFSHKIGLKTHNKLSHGRTKPHSCSICDSRFVLGSHLKLHSVQHIITK